MNIHQVILNLLKNFAMVSKLGSEFFGLFDHSLVERLEFLCLSDDFELAGSEKATSRAGCGRRL